MTDMHNSGGTCRRTRMNRHLKGFYPGPGHPFYRLFLILPAVCILATGCLWQQPPAPKAADGAVDLSGFDIEKNGPLSLMTGWLYFPGQRIFPSDFLTDEAPPKGQPLAWLADWDVSRGRRPTEPAYTTATLRLVVSGVNSNRPLGLRVGSHKDACRIWVNGSLIYEKGRIGTDRATGFPGEPDLVLLPLATTEGPTDFDIVIQLAEFSAVSYSWGLNVSMGVLDTMAGKIARDKAGLVFAVTLLLVMGLYHLVFYFFRRNESALLNFSLFCFCWMIEKGVNDVNYWLIHLFWPHAPVHLMERLDILGYAFSLPLLVFFIRDLFPDETPPLLPKLFLAATSALSVWLMVDLSANPLIYSCVHVVAVSAMVVVMTASIRAVLAGRRNGGIMLCGIFIVAFCGFIDILTALRITSGPSLITLGLLSLIVCQAVCLARRFAWSFHATEDLSLKLARANEDLKKLDTIKDEFLANTTHELLTPLSGIIGLAESMMAGRERKLPENDRNNLRMMVASGKRLNGLVRDILDFSRLKTRDIRLDLTPLDVQRAVKTVLTLVQPLAGAKNLSLSSHFTDRLPPVLADENRLHQILFNLIGNAVKYTQKGAVTVTAEREPDFIRVRISDTGMGIPEHGRERIFIRFEQVHTLPADGVQGTGLGLSIAKQLVELHRGEIGFQDRKGGGTTFFFALPIARLNELPENREPHSGKTEVKESPDPTPVSFPEPLTPVGESAGDREVILVVDDDPVNIQVAVNHLKNEGFHVLTALSGKEALGRMPAGRKPDLVLLDIMMPGMDGYETCRQIRQTHSMSDLPVIMLTARIQVRDVVMGFDAGANDYLTKPFLREELLARVRTQIRIRRAYTILKENTRLKKEVERRRLTELDLKLMQQRLARILDFLDDAIIAVNESLEICFANAAACHLTGYENRQLLGHPVDRLFGREQGGRWTDLEAFSSRIETAARIQKNDETAMACTVEAADLDIEGESLKVLVIRKEDGNTRPSGSDSGQMDPVSFIEKIGRNEKQIAQLENALSADVSFVHKKRTDEETAPDPSPTTHHDIESGLTKQRRRELGVTIMNQALALWVSETGTTKIDLAEQSGIWKVYMNRDGFERAQTLDKYLSLTKLPKNPRWPKIYRTVEYVLAGCPRNTPQRKDLKAAYQVLIKNIGF